MPSISSSLLPTTRKRARISDPLSITSSSSRIRLPLSQARKATAPVINARTTSRSFPEPPRKRRRTQRHAAIDSLHTRKSQPEVINLISDEEDDHIPTEDVPERLSPSCVSRLRAQASSSSVLADLTTSRSHCSSSPQKNKVGHSGYNASTEMIEATLRGGEETLSSVMHLLESRESPKVVIRSSPPSAIGSPSKPITISPTSSPAPPGNLFGDVETFNADEDERSPGSRDSPEIAADSDHPSSSPLSCQPIRTSLTSHGQPSPEVDEVIQASTAIEETLIAVKHLLQPRMDSPSRVPSPSRPIRSSPFPSPEAPVAEARWSPGPIPGSSQPVWSTLDVRASSSPSTSECDTEDQGTSPFFDDEEEVDELESSRQVSPIPHATDGVSMEMDVDGAPDLGTLAEESPPVLHNTSPFEDTAHTISNAKPLESSPTSPAPLPSSSALHPPSSAFPPPPPKRPRTSFTPSLFDRALTLRQYVSSRQSETPDLTHHSPASTNTPSSSTKGLETPLGKLTSSTSPPSTSSCLHTPDTPLSPPHIPLETFESDPDKSNPPWMMEDIDGSEMDLSEMHLFYPDD